MKTVHRRALVSGAVLAAVSLPSMAQSSVVSSQFRGMTFAVFGARKIRRSSQLS